MRVRFISHVSLLGLVVASAIGLAASPARADCDPPCPRGEVCRYEASGGGHFYCAASGPGSRRGGATRVQGRGGPRASTNTPDPTPGPARTPRAGRNGATPAHR